MRLSSVDIIGLVALGALPWTASAQRIISSSNFENCQEGGTIRVNNADIRFNRDTGDVTFDVSGTSDVRQNVEAHLVVTAYGIQVFEREFNPCDEGITQLCPVPAGTFSASGNQSIPQEFIDRIPSIAFSIPDLDGNAELRLTSADTGEDVGCINTEVSNGRTLEVPAVGYFAAGVAAAALVLSGISAGASAGTVGSSASSVGFATILGWFQTCATTGMYSVQYPRVYRSFSQNFAFSTGLVPWDGMQRSIDRFRNGTGGDLAEDNIDYLRSQLSNSSESNSTSLAKRGFSNLLFARQDLEVGVSNSTDAQAQSSFPTDFEGIGRYVENLRIPQSNTFMTVLLVFLIVVAACAVGILLFKVILETWALFGSFPKRLTGFRKRYWRVLGNTLTNLIFIVYGIWTTWCVYQLVYGDSWAAKTLAAVTWALFTGVLAFFTWRIVSLARKYKKAEGDANALFENKDVWVKYSLFYDTFKKNYWWVFIPLILFMFARGTALAAAASHGLIQTICQLVIEVICLGFFIFTRPFATKGGNWIHVCIQVVRVLSIICILVFVEQLGVPQTAQTITGVVLIAVQAGLSIILAILILINAIIVCCKENPHRKRRKEAEKMNRDFDNLTPLDARNSLLLGPMDQKNATAQANEGYHMGPYKTRSSYAPVPNPAMESSENLMHTAAPISHARSRSNSNSRGVEDNMYLYERQPTLPNVGIATSTYDRQGYDRRIV